MLHPDGARHTTESAPLATTVHAKMRGRAVVRIALAITVAAPLLADQRLLRATGFVAPDGSIQTPAALLIDDGQIRQVGGDFPANVTTDDYGTAVICPGLIDIRSALGAYGQLSETQSALQPDATAADTFDSQNAQLRAALQTGVTSFALTPDDRNLIGGRIAAARAGGPGGRPMLWDVPGPLHLSLSPDVFEFDREPTSRSGAIGMLRDVLSRAAAREPSDDTLSQFARGAAPGIITVPSAADVLATIALSDELKLRLTLVHQDDARAVASEVARCGAAVIVGPFDFSSGPRQTQSAGIFERAGVKVAIAAQLPAASLDSLRVSAAVAARDGLSSGAARRAITGVPAELLGLEDRVGSLAAGRAADLVVFSGDPLDLRSRVVAVYVAGVRLYVAPLER